MSNNVELISFCKMYGKKTACENINFFAAENSITGILGPNGAGKTSVLKAICGYHYATAGNVKVCGEEDIDSLGKITAFVPEFPNLDLNLTVKETLFFEAEIFGIQKSRIYSTVENASETCGLNDCLFSRCSVLSKGFRQRLSLAKALCKNPKVLVLDEFSAGLDPAQIISFRKTLKKISKSKTVIFSTHHIEEAASLCDKIYIFSNGKTAAFGTENEIIKESGCMNLEDAYIRITESQ